MAERGLVWIRVARVPAGDAPDDVRKRWIGVELPTRLRDGAPPREGRGSHPTRAGYAVSREIALAALAEHSEEAALYLRRYAPGEEFMIFAGEDVEVLDAIGFPGRRIERALLQALFVLGVGRGAHMDAVMREAADALGIDGEAACSLIARLKRECARAAEARRLGHAVARSRYFLEQDAGW